MVGETHTNKTVVFIEAVLETILAGLSLDTFASHGSSPLDSWRHFAGAKSARLGPKTALSCAFWTFEGLEMP